MSKQVCLILLRLIGKGIGQASRLVMVGGAVTHPTATPEPCVRVSPHTAPRQPGLLSAAPFAERCASS